MCAASRKRPVQLADSNLQPELQPQGTQFNPEPDQADTSPNVPEENRAANNLNGTELCETLSRGPS